MQPEVVGETEKIERGKSEAGNSRQILPKGSFLCGKSGNNDPVLVLAGKNLWNLFPREFLDSLFKVWEYLPNF
jgi:hypothetical protein